MIKVLFSTLVYFLLMSPILTQKTSKPFSGTYGDYSTRLTLKSDSTFELIETDPIFPYTFETFTSIGAWKLQGDTVVLNPHLEKRLPKVTVLEKSVKKNNDSISVKISYYLETYEKNKMVSITPFNFELLSIYINKRKDYQNIVHSPHNRNCMFSPRIKKQVVIDSTKIFSFPRQEVSKLGVYSYGFEKAIEIEVNNPQANHYEITVIQPLDKERMPRSKKVIIKRRQAYFYEWEGKISSGIFSLSPLVRLD
ncbi:hypothetical protein [Sphingobacterium sp. HMA12]|uniref:hypothetical protein n=1 Tax=Sphingobacterium sp. HMA12 TaxID=2050894 RepID=UPI000CEA1C2B|nr:hypothetical protein [Sphingobacterium sp. HMA12]